ncbi:MAG: hypothetical protein RSF73_08595, partial [Ruthenibacterium sp.]
PHCCYAIKPNIHTLRKLVIKMGDRNIKKEAKKPKKSDKNSTATFTSVTERPVIVQPELIKKAKKIK